MANILIVDDTPANLQLLISMLETHGYQVRPAKNAALALTAAQKSPPDLILLDIDMPDMDGYSICRALKDHPLTHEIPVVFISALGSPEEKVNAFRAGGVDFIAKPFNVEEVLARVETHLALRNKQREIERQHRVAASLRHILNILNAGTPRDEVLGEIITMAESLLGGSGAAIFSFTVDYGWRILAAHGFTTDIPLAGSLAEIQTTARPVMTSIHDVAVLAVPFINKGQVDGALVLLDEGGRTFAEADFHLALTFGEQALLAIENTRLQHQVHEAAILQERSRLARELHDSVTQQLYSLSLLAEGWRRLYSTQGTLDLHGVLQEVSEIAQTSLKEMRLLIYQLRPPDLQAVGLVAALQQRLELVERRTGIQTHLHSAVFLDFPPFLQENLYWITQEALNNALKHAQAQQVHVSLVRDEDTWVYLTIVDDGLGFNMAQVQAGMGLRTMQERAQAIGAELTFSQPVPHGTQVQIKLLYQGL